MVRTQCFHCGDLGSIPGQGTKIILQAVRPGEKNKNKKEMVRGL